MNRIFKKSLFAFAVLLIFVSSAYALPEPLQDSDGDGYTDVFEQLLRTDPFNPEIKPECCGGGNIDSDRDGFPDVVEKILRTDLFNKDSFPEGISPKQDTDRDGLSDIQEIYLYGTSPLEVDTNKDGISDYETARKNCCINPHEDNDRDGCTNAQEFEFGTDLNNPLDYDLSCYSGGSVSLGLPLIVAVFALAIGLGIGYAISQKKRV